MPVSKAVHSLLQQATADRQAGRMVRAIVAMEQASRLAPGNAHIHHDIGLAYLSLAQPDKALAALERAIAVDPSFGHAHFRRGIVLEMLGQPVEAAEDAYRLAIRHAPQIAEAHARMAALRHVAGRRTDAIIIYREAARRAGNPTQAGMYSARAALLDHDLDSAERHLRKVIMLDGNAVKAFGLLAYVKNARGEFGEAERLLRDALRRQPREVGLYYDLVQTRRIVAEDHALIARMRDAASGQQLPMVRARLHRALAKALDDIEDYAGATEHLIAASNLHAAHFPIDRKSLVSLVDRLIALLTPAYLQRADHLRHRSDRPILIIGMPRSGTTLTEQILSCHSQVVAGGEVHFWEARGSAYLQHADTGETELTNLTSLYLERLNAVSTDASYVTDKNPFNFMWAGLIHLAFPEARIVHCRRHPADNGLSIMFADLPPQKLFSHALDDLLFYYALYLRIMDHYRTILPADRFMELHYEDLVHEPERHTRALLAFCGLDWEDGCMSPEHNTRAVMTASVWQARQPIFTSSAGRRRHYETLLAPFGKLVERGSGT